VNEKCSLCGREFSDHNALWQHTKNVHGRKAAQGLRLQSEREASISEELTNAIIAASCGDPIPEYIETMFPEEIRDARQRNRP